MKGRAAMTNFEKYGDTSVPEYCKQYQTITNGEIAFLLKQYHEWGNSTAPGTLTPEERKIVEALQVLGLEWLARDMSEALYAYSRKPEKKKLGMDMQRV